MEPCSETMLDNLCLQLFEVGAIRFDDIEAKHGCRTPIYFDLRVVVSYPDIMVCFANEREITLSELLLELAKDVGPSLICGVPYAAIPLATILSVESETPMIIKRKELNEDKLAKIDGVFSRNQNCLVIEDVVSSGGSLLELVRVLRKEGLQVRDAIVVLDCEQGGASVLKCHGISVKSLFTMRGLIEILYNAGKLNDEIVDTVLQHITHTQFGIKDNM